MHFSFIKTLIKQVILFLFKEASASSSGNILSWELHSPRHIQGTWVAALGAPPVPWELQQAQQALNWL